MIRNLLKFIFENVRLNKQMDGTLNLYSNENVSNWFETQIILLYFLDEPLYGKRLLNIIDNVEEKLGLFYCNLTFDFIFILFSIFYF